MNTPRLAPVVLENPQANDELAGLVALMAALRTPDTGCAWDLEQDFASIAPYTIEEAHEVAEAIARNDLHDLRDELGDLLLQVVFHARMAEEKGAFALPDVIRAISEKLIRRHPHVFTDARTLPPAEVKLLWNAIKADEKRARAVRLGLAPEAPARILDGIPDGLPATQRALKIQQKAASVGFDWPSADPVFGKIAEELAECQEAFAAGDQKALSGEIGDLLFAVINLARHAGIDADVALNQTNAKFIKRFGHVEDQVLAASRTLKETSLEEMETLWVAAKQQD